MRLITNFAGALAIAGMASLAHASGPSSAATPLNTHAMLSAVQQDQTAPPKPDERQDQKQDKDAKAPKQPAARQQQTDKDQQRQSTQARQDQRQDARQDQRQQGGNHGRISDRDYQTHFSRAHSFTVRTVVTTTRIVPNQTRFVYGGYNFVFLQPWPAGWALTDDCYIDYINGEYVLIDLAHPGVMITLSIVG
ncbi:MAG: hypothetical protein WA294_13050 [Acidobacteriaceae bacterium]